MNPALVTYSLQFTATKFWLPIRMISRRFVLRYLVWIFLDRLPYILWDISIWLANLLIDPKFRFDLRLGFFNPKFLIWLVIRCFNLKFPFNSPQVIQNLIWHSSSISTPKWNLIWKYDFQFKISIWLGNSIFCSNILIWVGVQFSIQNSNFTCNKVFQPQISIWFSNLFFT